MSADFRHIATTARAGRSLDTAADNANLARAELKARWESDDLHRAAVQDAQARVRAAAEACALAAFNLEPRDAIDTLACEWHLARTEYRALVLGEVA